MTGTEIILLCIAAYHGTLAMILQTKDLRSAVMFKVVPMFSAVFLVLLAFKIV
jgi:hypothetical protein